MLRYRCRYASILKHPEIKKRRYRRSILRYGSTRYRRIFDIEVKIYISISKHLRYRSSNWGPAAPARAGLLIAIAGCSSVLGTYCSVTISLQVNVYPSAPEAAVPDCRRWGVPGKGACNSAAAVAAQKHDQVLHGLV